MKSSAQFLEDLLKKIVSKPDEVGVTQTDSVLEIAADAGDLGIIIGKGGKNIRALKSMVNLKTAKEGLGRLEIRIHEEAKQN